MTARRRVQGPCACLSWTNHISHVSQNDDPVNSGVDIIARFRCLVISTSSHYFCNPPQDSRLQLVAIQEATSSNRKLDERSLLYARIVKTGNSGPLILGSFRDLESSNSLLTRPLAAISKHRIGQRWWLLLTNPSATAQSTRWSELFYRLETKIPPISRRV